MANNVTPERLLMAILRVREMMQNKENAEPEEHTSAARRRRRRTRARSGNYSSRTCLPPDYPRAPLQDITAYVTAWSRSRNRNRNRARSTRSFVRAVTLGRSRAMQQGMIQQLEALEGGTELELGLGNASAAMDDAAPSTQHEHLEQEQKQFPEMGCTSNTSFTYSMAAKLNQSSQIPEHEQGQREVSEMGSSSNTSFSNMRATTLNQSSEPGSRSQAQVRPNNSKSCRSSRIKPLMRMR